MAGTRDQRIDARHSVLLRVDHGDDRTVHDVTENLSAGGLFVRTERVLPIGTRLALEVGFPGLLEPIEVEVEVVWVRKAKPREPGGIGVRIPVERAEDRGKLRRLAEAMAAKPRRRTRTFRILVVEDNPLIVQNYEKALRLLAGPGDDIELALDFAADGLTALNRLERDPPVDLIVTDLYMPVLDGFDLVRRIRAHPKLRKIPVVAISGGSGDTGERAVKNGVDVFLKKPVRLRDVLGTVRTLLRVQQ